MKRYSMNLESYIVSKPSLSIIKLLQISKSVLQAFQINHNAGITFNDLKLQNIMISGRDDNVNLIDYGMAT